MSERQKLVVVTAASSNHAGALRQLLASLRRLDADVECYDLGLTPREREALPRWQSARFHTFDYGAYPRHLDVNVNAGEYAWKPVIVAEVIDRLRAEHQESDVLWADAGCFFHALDAIAAEITRSGGLWVRRSAGTMRDWTHPLMFQYFGVDASRYADRRNADATLVGFAVGTAPAAARDAVLRDIVAPWKACALERDCIAPPGSSRRNHRSGYAFAGRSPRQTRVRCKCDRWFYRYVGYGVPAALYACTCLE